MKIKRRQFLKNVMGTSILSMSFSKVMYAQTPFVFWNNLFTSEIYLNQFVPWWEEQIGSIVPPDVPIEYGALAYSDLEQRFLISGQTGTPDLIEGVLSQVAVYKNAGLIDALNERFLAWDEHEQFIQNALEAVTIRGQLYGLPYIGNARALVYRKSILEKHGLDVPGTWEALLEAARTISANEKNMTGYMMTTRRGLVRGFQEFMSHVYQLTDQLFVLEDGVWQVNLSEGDLATILAFYRSLFFDGDSPAIPLIDRGKEALVMDMDYTVGKIAMMPNGPFIFARRSQSELQRQILEEDTAVAPLPLPPNGKPGTFLEVKAVMINTFSQSKDLAWEVAKLWTGQAGIAHHVALTGDGPTRQDVFGRLPDFLSPAAQRWQAQWAVVLPTGRALAPVPMGGSREAIFDAVQEAIFTDKDLNQVAQALHTRLKTQAQGFL